MNFLVVWTELAFEQMDGILRRFRHRRTEFAAALQEIASTLRADPQSAGESRAGTARIWFVGDLIVSYTVDDEERTVEVASIRLARRRSP